MKMLLKKAFIGLLSAMLLFVLLPPSSASAAAINWFGIKDSSTGLNVGSYLIAGREYEPDFILDLGWGTLIENSRMEYSVDGGATWASLPTYIAVRGMKLVAAFRMPYDPNLTSAYFRASMQFDPVIGNKSFSQKVIGPFKILQPGDPTDVEAKANNDGTVTLTWNDNSNMESHYLINRAGPDGDKQYTVTNTTDYTGPLSFTDTKTNKDKDTIYVYTLYTVIDDKYHMTNDEEPAVIYKIVKTKAPKKPDKIVLNKEIFIHIPLLDQINLKTELVTKPSVIELDKNAIMSPRLTDSVNKYLDNFNKGIVVAPGVDNDLIPVSSVKMSVKSIVLEPGESVGLIATVMPSDAANKKVTWESSDSKVATVDNAGKVTGITPGTAKVTVQTEEGGFTAICIITVSEPEKEAPMDDIIDHPAMDEIKRAIAVGFVTGYTDGTFKPEKSITRAEFATMLIKALEVTDKGDELTFKDKDKIPSWALSSVQLAVKMKIISGYQDNTFRANDNITHAEMIAMVIRASGLSTDGIAQSDYADNAAIPNWAKPAVGTAQLNGIIIVGGKPDKFEPVQLSTRAEAAAAIVKMMVTKI